MSKISNTLTRWHKVAARIKSKVAELSVEIGSDVTALQLDADSFDIRKEKLSQAAESAVTTKLNRALEFNAALFKIRAELAKANVTQGVSELLVQMEETRQNKELLTKLLDSSGLENRGYQTLTVPEFESWAAKKKKAAEAGAMPDYNSGRVMVSFVPDEQVTGLQTQVAELDKKIMELSDRLSDANASKLAIDLPDEVCKELGL